MTANKVINTKKDTVVYEIKLEEINLFMMVKYGEVFSIKISNRSTNLNTKKSKHRSISKRYYKKII